MEVLELQTHGSYNKDESIIASSLANEHYPVSVPLSPSFLEFLSDDRKLFLYSPPSLQLVSSNSLTYELFFYHFTKNISDVRLGFTVKIDEEVEVHSINVSKYLLRNAVGKILLILTATNLDNLSIENLKLFVSPDFALNPIYKNLYKRIYSTYITSCLEQGVRVEYMKSEEIEKKVYSNDFEVTFNTFEELEEDLKNVGHLFSYLPEINIYSEFQNSSDSIITPREFEMNINDSTHS